MKQVLLREARAEIITKGEQTGMLAVANAAVSGLDISGLLPPYPRPGKGEQMLRSRL